MHKLLSGKNYFIVNLLFIQLCIFDIRLLVSDIRDYDGHIYFREWSGGILGGGFEPKAKPCFPNRVPSGFEFQLLPEDWEHFRNCQFAVFCNEKVNI